MFSSASSPEGCACLASGCRIAGTVVSGSWTWTGRSQSRCPIGTFACGRSGDPGRRQWTKPFRTTPEEAAFWRAYQHELLARHLTKPGLLGLARTGADFLAHHPLAPGDLAGWPGRVLLLPVTDDRFAPPASQATLRRLYPGATVRTFHGAGHTPWLTRHDDYVAAIRAFIDGASGEGSIGGMVHSP